MPKPKSRLHLGPCAWDHHPDAVAEILDLKQRDHIAWQELGKRIRKSESQALTRRTASFPMASATHPVGHLPIDETSDPESYVRFYFGEHDGIEPVLGLSVAVKPSSYEEIGAGPTRAMQNEHISAADGRYTSHAAVLRFNATKLG